MTFISVDVESSGVARVREYELEEARQLQRAMVPEEPLHDHTVEIANQFRPVTTVGGDFLDYFHLSDCTLGIYLGDVVGKGLPAALYAALVVGTLRGINKTGEHPSAVLEMLNKRLYMRTIRERYCAVQYATYDPDTTLFRYSNAGLPGPLHLTARGCDVLSEGGIPAGMFPDVGYQEHTLRVDPGDSVLFITDGITDAQDSQGQQFGIERLAEVCSKLRAESAPSLLGRIFAELDRFVAGYPQYDDMAAAVLKFDPSPK